MNDIFKIYSVITGKPVADISSMTPHDLRLLINNVDYNDIRLQVDNICDSEGQQFELVENIIVGMNRPYVSDSKNFVFFTKMTLDVDGAEKEYDIAVYSDNTVFEREAQVNGIIYLRGING